jgi:CBS domain-containing protein
MGTLTDRDLAIRLVAEDRGGDETIDRIMTNEVIACSPEDDLTEALRLMRENHKSRILMVDKEGRLQGVISLSDIAQVAEEEGAETLRAVSEREANP